MLCAARVYKLSEAQCEALCETPCTVLVIRLNLRCTAVNVQYVGCSPGYVPLWNTALMSVVRLLSRQPSATSAITKLIVVNKHREKRGMPPCRHTMACVPM